jgi:hypothetical protein
MTTTHHNGDYIYEMEGVVLPFNKYDNDADGTSLNNMFYYYKQQTPKRSIMIKSLPNMPTEVDIYEDPKYHDIDTDEELDMDDDDVDTDIGRGSGHGHVYNRGTTNDNNDLLNKLTTYLASIPSIPNIPINSANPITSLLSTPSKRLTKKRRRSHGRHTKHANKARPKSSY